MPRQRTEHAWTLRVIEAISDGEWHAYEDVVKEAMAEVPEQPAFDKAEWYREYHYRKKGKEPAARRYGDREDTIRTGQRFIVSRSIQSLRRRRLVEVQYEDKGGVRKRPTAIRSIG